MRLAFHRNGDAVAERYERRQERWMVVNLVVGHQQSTWPEQADEPLEHRVVEFPVAVLEDQIERPRDFVQHPLRVADNDVDAIVEARAREVLARLSGSLLVRFHRDEHAVLRQRSGHPDAGVADRRADFEHTRRPRRQHEHAQQDADFGVDPRKSGPVAGARDVQQDRIVLAVECGEMLLDSGGNDLPHNDNELYMRRTKIIVTVGPATDSDAALDALIAAGADIFRLNFSHGTHASQSATYTRIRAAAARARRDVAILQDLGGPKIRTGSTRDGRPINVKCGDRLRIVIGDSPCEPGRISTTFEGLARAVKPGDSLLVADGLVELRVDATDGREIQTTVVEGGEIGDHKGINAHGVPLPASAITPKDVDDLHFGLSLGVDMIALSFVQSARDIDEARRLLIAAGADEVPLIAKLERPLAIEHLDEILAACDGVMVARGDLGLEMPLEKVPTAQKDITRRARLHGIPVIVATQAVS